VCVAKDHLVTKFWTLRRKVNHVVQDRSFHPHNEDIYTN
jgi:hypothetical protein